MHTPARAMTSLANVRPMVVLSGALLGASGCYRTQISSAPTHDLGYDRRTPSDAEGAEISSEWQAAPGRITGKVQWGSCRIERMEYRFDTITTRREPNKIVGYSLLGGGVMAAALGIALWGASASCPNGGCSGEKNSTFLILGLGAGLPAIGVGGATLLGNVSVKDERTPRKEDVKDEVGPCIEPGDPVAEAVARGQHDHRRRIVAGTHGAQHVEAVAARQAEVEQHEVEALARQRAERRRRVAHPVDREALQPQRATQAVADHAVVFHQQQAHRQGSRISR